MSKHNFSPSASTGTPLWIVLLGFGVTTGLVLWLLGSKAPTTESYTNILTREGYTDITLTGWQFFGCGSGDFYREGFTAVKNGQTVNGLLCSGVNKGATIRF